MGNKKSKSKKMQVSPMTRKILFFTAAGILLVLLIAGIAILVSSKDYTVAFYRVEELQQKGIKEEITRLAEKHRIKVLFKEYESEKALKDQFLLTKKPNILFTPSGFALDTAVEKASPIQANATEMIQSMTSSIRSALKTNKSGDKVAALPILSSHFEADIETSEFRSSNVKRINTWTDVEKFMLELKRTKEYPMIFAGGNSDFFLDLLGAFAESLDSVNSYNEAVEILKSDGKKLDPVKAAKKLCDEPVSPLATTVKMLSAWYKKGLIHPGTFSMQMNDVSAFASSRLSSILFMPLETHRTFPQKSISRYTSIYMPSELNANARVFTGKIYYAVPMSKSKMNEKILSELTGIESQENLSRSTGLAPVLAQCRTPDKQASEARYWIAATTTPLAGLSNEVYLTKEQKNVLCAEIASRIKR